jgi:hypothetical protein
MAYELIERDTRTLQLPPQPAVSGELYLAHHLTEGIRTPKELATHQRRRLLCNSSLPGLVLAESHAVLSFVSFGVVLAGDRTQLILTRSAALHAPKLLRHSQLSCLEQSLSDSCSSQNINSTSERRRRWRNSRQLEAVSGSVDTESNRRAAVTFTKLESSSGNVMVNSGSSAVMSSLKVSLVRSSVTELVVTPGPVTSNEITIVYVVSKRLLVKAWPVSVRSTVTTKFVTDSKGTERASA